MMRTRDDIFVEARLLPEAEREAYLQEACSDADEIASVRALLADAPEIDSFFGDCGDADEDEIPGSEREGDGVGLYTLRQKIGEGGFGTVWMAEQTEPIARMVALKVVKAGMDTKQVLARFEAERRALAMMDHPNIAKVLDAGATETGRPYFAMDLVRGVPITQFCNEQKFGPKRRIELFLEVCSAINHAHQKGIIHRDIKPSNVMVTLIADKPVAKVIDFGIAKATQGKLTDRTLFTRFEQFVGTPVYMAPEQAAMSGVDIDTRSDIYSLGVLLYELLAGTPPFDSETLISAGYDEMRRIICEDDPPKPSTRLTEMRGAATGNSKPRVPYSAIPTELDWIVMKAIEKDRTRRYETANELAVDVGRHLANEPVSAARPSATYRLRKYVRRNRGLVTSLAAVFTVLAMGVVGMSILFVKVRKQKEVAVSMGEEARSSEEAARGYSRLLAEQKNIVAAQSETWRRQAYAANIVGAHLLWKEQKAGRARELLEVCPEDLRNWEWRWLWHLVDRNELVADGLGGLLGAWFSPDGRSVLSFREEGRYQLWDRGSGEERFDVEVGGSWIGWEGWRGTAGAFTVDGKEVFLGGTKAVGRWDLATGEQLASFDDEFPIDAQSAFGIAFHSTPERVIGLVIGTGGALQIHDFTKDDVQLISTLSGKLPGWIFSVNFSRDGKFVAAGEPGFTQFVYEVDSGAMVGTIPGSSISFGRSSEIIAATGKEFLSLKDTSSFEAQWETRWEVGQATAVEIARDGRHVFVGGIAGNLIVRDATTGVLLGTHGGHLSSIVSIEESPDEREVLTASKDGSIRVWPAERVTEPFAESLVLSASPSGDRTIAFNPDGSRLVSAGKDGMTKVWDTSTGQELLTIRLAPKYGRPTADFSPDRDKQHVVTGGSGGEPLRIWDIDSGQAIRQLRGTTHHTRLVKFSPDGTRIAAAVGDSHILVWDAKTGDKLARIEHGAEAGLAFSPDGSKIAFSVTRNYDHLGICDAETGELLRTFKQGGGAGFRTVVFSPDGTKIATGGDDHNVRIWDVESGELLRQLKRHTLEVLAVAFSPDPQGSRLFTGGRDETLRVWDAESGEELLVIPTGSEIWGIAVSADEKMVATAGGDGTIQLWETERPTPSIQKRRRIVAAASQLVDERSAQYPSDTEVNESLFSDGSINAVEKKIALQILQARRGVRADAEPNRAP